MDLENFCKGILHFEKKYPVDQWMYNEVYIWPFIRTRLYLFFKDSKSNRQEKHASKKSKLFFLIGFFYSIIQLVKAKGRKNIILSNAAFRSNINGFYFDRIADPILLDLKNQNQTAVICEFATNFQYNTPVYSSQDILHIQPIYLFLRFFNSYKKQSSLKAEGLEELLNDVIDFWPESSNFTNYASIEALIKSYYIDILAWKSILNFIKPENVYLNCFYDSKGISMVAAANLLRIKTIDLQHGIQGRFHLSYTSWGQINDSKAKAFLPNEFYVWDRCSANNISEWGGNAIIKGYPWMELWKNGFFKMDVSLPKNIILYTIQPLDDPFPASFVDALKEIPKLYYLFVRLHPHHLDKLNHYKELYKKLELDCEAEFEVASNTPLPIILNNTVLHITKWSTVAIEASFFEIPTLFLTKTGLDIFKEQIDESLIFFEKPLNEILK